MLLSTFSSDLLMTAVLIAAQSRFCSWIRRQPQINNNQSDLGKRGKTCARRKHGCYHGNECFETRNSQKREKTCYLCHDEAREKTCVLMIAWEKENLGPDWPSRLHLCHSNTKLKVNEIVLNLQALEGRYFPKISKIALGLRAAGFNVEPFVWIPSSQTRSVPLQVPFSVHLLTIEPFASNPLVQENLHTVLYNISVVLHPNSSPLDGGDSLGHVTAKWRINQWFTRQLA